MRKLSEQVTKAQHEALYAQHTDAEIAAQFGVSDASVGNLRREWSIATRSLRSRREVIRGGGYPLWDEVTPAQLAEMYVKLSDRGIASLYGITKPTVSARRRAWGVESLSKGDRAAIRQAEMTEDQKQVCLGTLLGDGHLIERGSLKVTHAWHQFTYLKWKHTILSPHVCAIGYEESVKEVTGTRCFGFLLRTTPHTWLKSLHKVFYPDGRRIFPSSVLESLEPLGLAVWYFDDGHLSDGLPSFALGSITTEEAEEVCTQVRARFGLDTYVGPQSTETCKIMSVRARSADILFHLVRGYATGYAA
jgi:hypothetical protein